MVFIFILVVVFFAVLFSVIRKKEEKFTSKRMPATKIEMWSFKFE